MSSQMPPLSEDELVELDSFLLSDACGEDALTVDEAHGFLTALIVGPAEVKQEEWLPAVWGQPKFTDEAQRQRMTSLLIRMHEEIASAVQRGVSFEPLVAEEEDEGEVYESYEGWCLGFMLGVEHCQEQWDALPKDEQALLAPMAQLALLMNEEEPDIDEDEYASWVELLPGAVAGLYGYWRASKRQE